MQMQILLDTADLTQIKKYNDIYNISGVTTNPSILSQEKREFFPIFHEIKEIIGDKQLHVQVISEGWEDMVKDAKAILDGIDKDVYIKVPVNEQGIKAMKELKQGGVNVTGTAIYTLQQAVLAASVGADYVAPYFNRMSNLNMDSKKIFEEIATMMIKYNLDTKILAASFKNTNQIMEALLAGASAVTLSPELLTMMVDNTTIDGAVDGFRNDWVKTYGKTKIFELE